MSEIRPATLDFILTHMGTGELRFNYPIIAGGMKLNAQKGMRVKDLDLFKAVCLGYHVDLCENVKRETKLRH